MKKIFLDFATFYIKLITSGSTPLLVLSALPLKSHFLPDDGIDNFPSAITKLPKRHDK